MTKQGIRAIGTAVLVAGLFVAIFSLSRSKPVGAPTVFMNYVGNTAALGAPTFWLTNCTSKALVVDIWTVEVQAGTNWVTYGSPSKHQAVGPTAGMYVTIPFAYQQYPTNAWRVSGVASEQLSGFEAVLAAIHGYPRVLWLAYRTRKRNLVANPFAKSTHWYGNHRTFISQTVTDEKSIR